MADYINIGFPDDLASNTEKVSREFGEDVGKAISSQWFQGQIDVRRRWITEMRQYSRGEQDTAKYKALIEGDSQASTNETNLKTKTKTHKIDYVPLKIMPTFKDIVVNAIDESLFKPRAEAIDITAVNKKKDYFKKLEDNYYSQDIARIVGQGVGIDLVPQDTPQNLDELNVRKLEYKPKIELAQELAIENVFKHEKVEAIKDKCDEDLFDLGFGVGRDYTDYTEGIKIKYVDPYNYVHSPFEMDDGRDIRYHGVIEKTTIADLIKQSGGISKSDLLKIKNLAIGKTDNNIEYNEAEDAERLVEFVTFAYLTGEERVYKKQRRNKSVKLIDRTKDGYDTTKANKKITIPYQVWYEGVYVPNAEVLLKWRKIPNQVESEINKPISPFKVYAPKVKRLSETGQIRFDSMVQRAKPIVDDLHRDWYKFQQLKLELRPNTVTINPQALTNVILNGEKIDPQTILDLFFGRGVLIANEYDEEGDPIGKAITEQNGGVNNSALGFLSNEFTNNYNRLRQVIGINEVRDGTTQPNSKTAVTVQKLLLASSNNQTNHIVKASFNLSLAFAESVSLRLYDVLTTPALKNRYLDIIGSDNVELLSEIKQFPMTKFAIYFDFRPDNEERIAFEQSLITSYTQKEINIAQYNKARQIKNSKSANKYLEITIENNEKEKERQRIANIEAQAKANAQTSVITEQTKQQTLTIEYDIFKQRELFKDDIGTKSERRKAEIEELQNQLKHRREMELEGMKIQAQMQKIDRSERAKDERIDQQSSNQAELIKLRKGQITDVDFKKELNSIFNLK